MTLFFLEGLPGTYFGDSTDAALYFNKGTSGTYFPLSPYTFFGKGGSPAPPVYDPDAAAYFAAMTVQPDTTRKDLINTLIVNLKSAGVWSKLDWLCLFASHDLQSGLLNAVSPAKTAIAVNSPSFTADRGLSGDGVTAYINYNESVTGGDRKATLNDVEVFAYCNLQGASSGATGYHFSQATSSYRVYINANSAGNESFRAHDNASGVARASTDRKGFRASARGDSANRRAYYNGSLVATQAVAVTGTSGLAAQALRSTTTSYSDDRLACGGWGQNLTDAENTAFHTALHTYLTAIGANY